jgi:hypothetical protein
MARMRFQFKTRISSALAAGLFLLVCGLALVLLSGVSAPPFSGLQHVEGRIETARLRRPNQAKSYYQFEVGTKDDTLLIQLPDLSYSIPALKTIEPGQEVEMWATPNGISVGRTVYWAWQIRRGAEMILSYEQRVNSYQGANRRSGYVGEVISIVGLLLAVSAGLLPRWVRGRLSPPKTGEGYHGAGVGGTEDHN